MRAHHLLLGLVVVALAGCQSRQLAVEAEPTYDLKLSLEKGQEFPYVIERLDVEPQDSFRLGTVYRVEDVTPQSATVNMEFTEINMAGQDLTAAMKQVAGDVSLEMVMNERGEVLSHEWIGASDQFASFVGNASGNIISLPGTPVKVGETWTGKLGLSGEEVPMSFKLVSVEGSQARIEATIEGETDIKLEGPVVIVLDLESGLPLEQTMKGEFPGVGKGTFQLRRESPATAEE